MTDIEMKIKDLIDQKHDLTMGFMRSVRAYKMSVRGTTVLHVMNPGTHGATVAPMLRAVLRSRRADDPQPSIIGADGVEQAKEIIADRLDDIRIVVVELDLEKPREGLVLINWVRDNYPNLPVLLAANDEKEIPAIREESPYLDVFLAGSMGTSQMMQLFGSVLGYAAREGRNPMLGVA